MDHLDNNMMDIFQEKEEIKIEPKIKEEEKPRILIQCNFEDCKKVYTKLYNLKIHTKTFH